MYFKYLDIYLCILMRPSFVILWELRFFIAEVDESCMKSLSWWFLNFTDPEINTSNGGSHEGCHKGHVTDEQTDEYSGAAEGNA